MAGKRIIVAGASSGIGCVLASKYAAEDNRVGIERMNNE